MRSIAPAGQAKGLANLGSDPNNQLPPMGRCACGPAKPVPRPLLSGESPRGQGKQPFTAEALRRRGSRKNGIIFRFSTLYSSPLSPLSLRSLRLCGECPRIRSPQPKVNPGPASIEGSAPPHRWRLCQGCRAVPRPLPDGTRRCQRPEFPVCWCGSRPAGRACRFPWLARA